MFFAIKRDLASTNRRIEDIANDYPVGASTVSYINRTVTWDNYLANVIAKSPIRGRAVKSSDPVVRRDKAEKAGLKPVDTKERRKDSDFSVELKKIEEKYATKDEVSFIETDLRSRLTTLHERMKTKQDAPSIAVQQEEDRVAARDFGISLAITIVAVAALVLAIIK